ncbi:MAG: hypothetical protein K6E98_02325, partial [Lachnospiraceae bacterium]|nr:hypothetical protein [Lachnospiraceae bacterium]
NAVIDTEADNGGIKISDANAKAVKNAFTVTYDKTGADSVPAGITDKTLKAGKAIIYCTNPELLTADKSYSLVLEPEWKGQFVDSTAQTVTVKVKVR